MPETALDSVKFLLVDDLEDNLVALAALLRRPGLDLYMSRSGTEALELLLKHDFALAIIDVHMPEMDGFELAELLRGTERCKHLPIIFTTAAPREHQRVFKGYESGAVDFLFKPIDPHILRHKAEVFFELYRQRQLLSLQVAEHERLLAETRETLRLNEMFTAALSHDLRTPLNAVVAGAALILQGGDALVTKKAAERILSSGRRMTEMIEQLLDLSRARLSGGIGIAPQPMDLRVLAERIVGEVQAVEPRPLIELTTQGDLHGEWDETRLGQVLSNLLTNAVRHGAPGTIRIQLSGTEPEQVTLSVQNAGTIAEEVRGQLFDPFRSAGSPATRQGLGLGLYIVKQIVEAHEGTIEAQSEPSFGTRFVIRLPRLRS